MTTHRYACGHSYTLLKPEERVYGVRKPADPQAVRFGGTWYSPLQLLVDEARTQPQTIPDDETLLHRATCRCEVCRRPEAAALWRKKFRGRR